MLLWRAKHYLPWQFLKIRCHIRDFGCKLVSLTWRMLHVFQRTWIWLTFWVTAFKPWLLFKSKLCMVLRNTDSYKRYSWSSSPFSFHRHHILPLLYMHSSVNLFWEVVVLLFLGFVWFSIVFSFSDSFLIRETVNPSLVIFGHTLLISGSSLLT